MFFMANNITETSGEGEAVIAANEAVRERKKATLLSEVGPEVSGTLVNLLAPKKDVPFKDILKGTLTQHLRNRWKLQIRHQKQNEKICEYIVALKNVTLEPFLTAHYATDLFVG